MAQGISQEPHPSIVVGGQCEQPVYHTDGAVSSYQEASGKGVGRVVLLVALVQVAIAVGEPPALRQLHPFESFGAAVFAGDTDVLLGVIVRVEVVIQRP